MTEVQRFFYATEEHVDMIMSRAAFEPQSDNIDIFLKDKGIAYYPIFGHISDTRSYYTQYPIRKFENDLKRNDADSSVSVHFLHVNSGGGESWYLEQLSQTLRSLKKPIYAVCEKTCCSAAYCIACNATRLVALTNFDKIGSIGTMSILWNSSGNDKLMGHKEIIIYSSRSDLKNKIEDDAMNGKIEAYRKKYIDPVQASFEESVKLGRKQLNLLPEEHPVFRGEAYYASEALTVGLIDGIVGNLDSAIDEACAMVSKFKNQTNILKYVNQ